MIFWTFKQLKSVRQAIAGRNHPSQLAWGVAFGLLLGVVPHGNLLAVALLLLVLSLKLNHAMAGLTAVATTFAATHLDPFSHQIGERILTHPETARLATSAWQYPLVPWTDLNNTIVLGSLVIGLVSLLPAFVLTYPIFRWLAPDAPAVTPGDSPDPEENRAVAEAIASAKSDEHQRRRLVKVDGGHQEVRPHQVPAPDREPARVADVPTQSDFVPVAESEGIPVETRIDVIRMKDYREASNGEEDSDQPTERAIDEALSYLLRQLRDSQQKDAA